jgi:kumamolisin
VPKELAGAVQTVVGLNNRPIAHPHNTGFVADQTGITAKDAPSSGYLPNAVSKAENFPANDGKGSNISFVELGGGYKQSDLNAAWKADGIKNGPQFKDFSVDGATNSPEGSLNGADGEVYLDAEVAGAQAPGANFEMDWAPNSAQGFMDGTREAGQRQIAAGKPGAVSISWGAPEAEAFSVADMQAFDGVLKNLADKGVNVYVASGDNGSVDGAQDGKDHVDFPSASTNVVSVGGTKLELGSDGKRESEVAWGDIAIGEGASGGGFSNVFGQPDYQTKDGIKVPDGIAQGGGRGVPDIAGNAAPSTGYHVTGEGQGGSIGGTSGAAPSAAALDATLRTGLGGQNIGFLNPTVYAHPEVFTKITEGTNGTYSANADGSWNAVTGLGVPDGQKLLEVLKQKGAAENPTA